MLSKRKPCVYLPYKRDQLEKPISTTINLHPSKFIQNKNSYRPGNGIITNYVYNLRIVNGESRMRTFMSLGWKYLKYFPMSLSEAGFHFRGEGTYVHCHICNLKTDVKEWFDCELPYQAHARLRQKCKFVIENKFKINPNCKSNKKNKETETIVMQATSSNAKDQENTTEHQRPILSQLSSKALETDGSTIQNHNFHDDSNVPSNIQAINTTDAMNSQVLKYMEYKDFNVRLKTFANWVYESKQKARNLAEAGYFYTGESDIVRCFCCDLGLAEWDPKDDCWTEHARHGPTCWFLLCIKGESFVQKIQIEWKRIYNPKHAAFDDKESRVNSFVVWRTDVEQTPEILAEAGFFYTGEEDIVRCHYCDGGLRNWEPGDDPWEEHTRWFPFCKFVIKMKGREYIEEIKRQSERRQVEDDAATPSIEMIGTQYREIVNRLRDLKMKDEDINYAISLFPSQKEAKELTLDWAMNVILDKNDRTKNPFAVENVKKENLETNDQGALLETNKKLKEKFNCMRCKENEACMLFVDCGHRVTCESCAGDLDYCLYCNTKITNRMKTFLS